MPEHSLQKNRGSGGGGGGYSWKRCGEEGQPCRRGWSPEKARLVSVGLKL